MLDFLGVITFILVIFSPIIIFMGLVYLKYEFDQDFIRVKFLGITIRKVEFSNIESFRSFNHFPFLKGKYENILLNKAVMIKFKKMDKFTKAYVVIPRDRDEFIKKLNAVLKPKNTTTADF